MIRDARVVGLMTIAAIPSWCAQNPGDSDSTPTTPTFRSKVDLLSIAVRVTDRKGDEVHGLTADQFALYEDMKTSIHKGTDALDIDFIVYRTSTEQEPDMCRTDTEHGLAEVRATLSRRLRDGVFLMTCCSGKKY